MSRLFRACLVALTSAGALILPAVPAAADGSAFPPIVAITPDQFFNGAVNGKTGESVIRVVCLGPIGPNSTGHPAAGQTVKVLLAPESKDPEVGFTGSAGTGVLVGFDAPSVVTHPLVLHAYDVTAEIPTSLSLPCFGTGTVTFHPVPTSPTARDSVVTVTYVS